LPGRTVEAPMTGREGGKKTIYVGLRDNLWKKKESAKNDVFLRPMMQIAYVWFIQSGRSVADQGTKAGSF
jgi:hypothetical protein